MKNKELAKNIHVASGGHGLTLQQLEDCLSNIDEKTIDIFAYTLAKASEYDPTNAFSTTTVQYTKPITSFTQWFNINEKYSIEWGFPKNNPGCYIYGLFIDNTPDTSPANFLDPNVIYIGESRSVKRNSMLGRRNDFKSTVNGNPLSPYGCGTMFKSLYGKDNLQYTYQAFMPTHPYWTKQIELDLLSAYYNAHNKVPSCNPPIDQKKSHNHQQKIFLSQSQNIIDG